MNQSKLHTSIGGVKRWYLNGKLHRDDGPAVELDEHKEWYINGKRHREDGPAIEHWNGTKFWYLNDKELSAEELFRQMIPEQQENYLWSLGE
jgi:hypothetical protein